MGLKKIFFLLFILICTPIMVSVHHAEERKVYGEYQSKEGPMYISYSMYWNKQKLIQLHEELLKNLHGRELKELTRVVVDTTEPKNITGYYDPSDRSIHLLYGNRLKKAEQYRNILSHEYGHHVQEIYFYNIDKTKNTKWFKLRGLKGYPVHTGYSTDNKWEHEWYIGEIFADDYMMLFGSTGKLKSDTTGNSLLYQLRTEHENSTVPNVMEQPELLAYLEKITGWKIDKSRLLKKIYPIGIIELLEDEDYDLSPYLIMNAKQNYTDRYDVEFYSMIDFYREIIPNTFQWKDDEEEGFNYQSNDEGFLEEDLSYEARYGYFLKKQPEDKFKGIMKISYTSVDTRTGLSVASDPVYIYVKDPYHQFKLLTMDEVKSMKLIEKKK